MRYRDGLKEPTTLFEAAAYHYRLKATCQRCQHVAVFDSHALWWLFQKRGYERGDFRFVASKLWCRRCGYRQGRRARIELTRDEATIMLPLPDEREWKRAISRHRG